MPKGVFTLTTDWRRKIGESNRGKVRSEETIRKLSISHMGHFPSDDTRKKMSDTRKGYRLSEEGCKKISESKKGTPRPESVCKRIGDAHRGEKSRFWKGGISFEPYCPLFNDDFKRRVRAYFGHKCVECEMSQEENGKALSVHHVHYDKKTCCKEGEDVKDRKFVALCKSCHTSTNTDRDFWEDWYTEIINEFYDGKCYISTSETVRGASDAENH